MGSARSPANKFWRLRLQACAGSRLHQLHCVYGRTFEATRGWESLLLSGQLRKQTCPHHHSAPIVQRYKTRQLINTDLGNKLLVCPAGDAASQAADECKRSIPKAKQSKSDPEVLISSVDPPSGIPSVSPQVQLSYLAWDAAKH